MKVLKGLLCLALLAGMSGCHLLHGKLSYNTCNESHPYQSDRSAAPLKIPSGLDSPETTNALHLPQLNEPAPPPRALSAPCLDAPPSFKVAVQKPAPQA